MLPVEFMRVFDKLPNSSSLCGNWKNNFDENGMCLIFQEFARYNILRAELSRSYLLEITIIKVCQEGPSPSPNLTHTNCRTGQLHT